MPKGQGIFTKLAKHEARLSAHEQKLESHEHRLNEHGRRLDSIDEDLAENSRDIDDLVRVCTRARKREARILERLKRVGR